MRIIAIAGGSGAGKTTVSNHLLEKYSDIYEIFSLDTFQINENDPKIPKVDDYINWDHPKVILWDKIINLLKNKLNNNKSSKKILIVDGYLGLYNDELNKLYDLMFYLDLSEKERNKRRIQARGGRENKKGQEGYIKNVLNPMHNQYVETTKNKADYIINTAKISPNELAKFIHSIIVEYEH